MPTTSATNAFEQQFDTGGTAISTYRAMIICPGAIQKTTASSKLLLFVCGSIVTQSRWLSIDQVKKLSQKRGSNNDNRLYQSPLQEQADQVN